MLLIDCVLFSAFPLEMRLQVTCGSVAAGHLWLCGCSPTACAVSLWGEAPAWAASLLELEAEFPAQLSGCPRGLWIAPQRLFVHTLNKAELLQTAQDCGMSPVSSCPAWLCWGSRARVSCGQAVLVLFGVWNSCWTPELAPSPLQMWSRQFLVPLGHPQG